MSRIGHQSFSRLRVSSICGWVAVHHPGWALLLVIAGVLHAVFHGAVAWMAASLGRAIAAGSTAPMAGSAIVVASLGLGAVSAKGLFGILASLAQTRLSSAAGQALRDHILSILLATGSHAPGPATITRLSSRLREAEAAIANGPFAVARAILQLLPIIAGLFVVSPGLTVLAIAMLAPFSLVLSLARRRWRHAYESSMRASDAVHEEMDDLIRHLDLWRCYGSGGQVREVVSELGARAASAHLRAQTLGVTISSTNEVLGATALLAVLVVAAHGFGTIDGASVIAFIALFFLAYRPLRDLGDGRTAWLRGREALRTLSQLPVSTETSAVAGTIPRAEPSVHVRIERVGVPPMTPCVSFDLPAGRMVAIAGPTGAGKTTLVRALLGLEPSAVGEVSVNGYALAPGQVGPAYRPFAWVPQDAPVISGSLDDNLRLGGATCSHAYGHLAALGAGALMQDIGEDKLGACGRTLSGGERRWVSLARALATGFPVLLLDEPTVGLDARARKAALEVLQRIKGKRSLVVASHDQDVLSMSDEVVTLE